MSLFTIVSRPFIRLATDHLLHGLLAYSCLGSLPVCPDWAIYWTLGNFLKPLATINLPQSPPILGNFCKGIKIIHFSSETIFGQLLDIWRFFSGHTVHYCSIPLFLTENVLLSRPGIEPLAGLCVQSLSSTQPDSF